MKKIILAALFIITLDAAAFTGETVKNKKLLADLTTALDASHPTQWSTKTNSQKRQTFNFNGKVAYACFYEDSELAGFSVPLNDGELPIGITEAVAQKYAGWNIGESLLFIDASANSNYFVQINKGKANLAIKVSIDGHTTIFSKM